MQDWVVNLIVGLSGALLGFIGGFFTKTYQIKIKQKVKGDVNTQKVEINNGNKKD